MNFLKNRSWLPSSSSNYTIKMEVSRFRNQDKPLDLFGKIIHSSEFDIIAHDFWIKSRLGLFKNDYEELYKASKFKNHFKPLFRLTTDRTPLLFCEVIEVATSTLKFLEDTADELTEIDIDLGEYECD